PRGRGPPLRPPLLGPQARRGRGLDVGAESALAHRADGLPPGAVATGRPPRRPLPVRAPGLLQRRLRGLDPVAPGLHPGGRPPGHLGEDREGGPLGGAPPRPHAVITPNVATPRSSRPAGRRAGMPTRALPVDRA